MDVILDAHYVLAFTGKLTVGKVLPDRESNPGLPRDRRGYSPLYYRGLEATSDVILDAHYVLAFTGKFTVGKVLPDRESNPGLPRGRREFYH